MADQSTIGMEFPASTFIIEKDKIIEFAIAVSQKEMKNQIHPVYHDEKAAKAAGYEGIPIPPTFLTSSFFWTGDGLTGMVTALGINLKRLLHREEEYEYFGPIHAGDIITRKMKVADIIKKGKGVRTLDMTILEVEYINHRNELVAKSRTTLTEI
ncbi:MAG TPA: MaoC family dehydratase N-terminal domain-containing protein [Smithella sp.]|nr:MaoC family dehydratase N-terminal domain-containing protein [Smithella sp.]